MQPQRVTWAGTHHPAREEQVDHGEGHLLLPHDSTCRSTSAENGRGQIRVVLTVPCMSGGNQERLPRRGDARQTTKRSVQWRRNTLTTSGWEQWNPTLPGDARGRCQAKFKIDPEDQDFPGGPVAMTLCSHAGAWIHPSSGNQIPHATTKTWCSQINKNKLKNKNFITEDHVELPRIIHREVLPPNSFRKITVAQILEDWLPSGRVTWYEGGLPSGKESYIQHFIINVGDSPLAPWEKICLPRGRPGFNPWVEKIPQRRKWQSTSGLLPRKSHGRRSLMGYSPQGHKRVGHDLATKQQLKQSSLENHVTISSPQMHIFSDLSILLL